MQTATRTFIDVVLYAGANEDVEGGLADAKKMVRCCAEGQSHRLRAQSLPAAFELNGVLNYQLSPQQQEISWVGYNGVRNDVSSGVIDIDDERYWQHAS